MIFILPHILILQRQDYRREMGILQSVSITGRCHHMDGFGHEIPYKGLSFVAGFSYTLVNFA